MLAAKVAPASASGTFWMDYPRSIVMVLVSDYYKVLRVAWLHVGLSGLFAVRGWPAAGHTPAPTVVLLFSEYWVQLKPRL